MKTWIFIGMLVVAVVVTPETLIAQDACYSGVLSIPASNFHPIDDSVIYQNYGNSLNVIGKNGYCHHFYAPLKLPHGSVVTHLGMEADDTSSTVYVQVFLFQYQRNSTTTISSLDTGLGETPGAGTYEKNIALTIDNENYSYGLKVSMCGNPDDAIIFYRARIKYDIVDCPPNKVVVIPLGD